ncbi:MAG: hypothetical protein KBF89_07950 [Acidimicrobiia bacterium]|nr:hypothetical protein [Acidimicrobiia bacterium]
MSELTSLENRIAKLELRNKMVESNKRWETSFIRRISIATLTYFVILAYHVIIGAKNMWIISAVPVLGFVISTLSLQYIRKVFDQSQE